MLGLRFPEGGIFEDHGYCLAGPGGACRRLLRFSYILHIFALVGRREALEGSPCCGMIRQCLCEFLGNLDAVLGEHYYLIIKGGGKHMTHFNRSAAILAALIASKMLALRVNN